MRYHTNNKTHLFYEYLFLLEMLGISEISYKDISECHYESYEKHIASGDKIHLLYQYRNSCLVWEQK